MDKKRVNRIWKIVFIVIFLLVILTGFFNFIGYTFIEPSIVEFDVNETWNLSDGFTRVSQGIDIFDKDIIVVVDKIVVNLSEYNLTEGIVYIDLIINETIVDSEVVNYLEEDIPIDIQSGDSPTHDFPILNSTIGRNLTTENLTVYNQSTTDVDGDEVKNIINWYKNEESFLLINAPFEGGSNSSSTMDYVQGSYIYINGSYDRDKPVWNSSGGRDGYGAYELNRTQRMLYPHLLDNISNFTLSFWFKPHPWFNSSASSGRGLFSKYNAENTNYFDCSLNSFTGKIRCQILFNDGTSDLFSSSIDSWEESAWYHIVFRWDTLNGTTLWVNGTYDSGEGNGTEAIHDTSCPNGTYFVLGGIGEYGCPAVSPSGYSNPTVQPNFTIDDFMVFNYSLSSQQILLLYQNRTDVIHSSITSATDIWQACITPNDGSQDGITKCSGNLTILGINAPTVDSIIINSTSTANYSNGSIQTSWVFSDSDGELQLDNETKWVINNVYNI
ncbi:MAG: LamG-like jellyroll fold domain-containing protein, partial [archaeon]